MQQAWDYAVDVPGSQWATGQRWVLVSNCTEIRLYAFGRGREAHEYFDLARLDEPDEFSRLHLVLGAENLTGAATAELLEKSEHEDREITTRLYQDYQGLRERLIQTLDDQNPGLGRLKAIEYGQTILDRLLFVAFAEDTRLLPKHTITGAYESRNKYNPQPIWENFKTLFRWIDKGNPTKNIPAYNGGLFAEDLSIENLTVPDALCEGFATLGTYDYQSEVSVDILGHIFEQQPKSAQRSDSIVPRRERS